MAAQTGEPSTTLRERSTTQRLTNLLGPVIFAGICALLVAVVLEGWLVVIFGHRRIAPGGELVVDPASWPKSLKTVLYFGLAGLAAAKLTLDRGWGRLRTRADIALVVLGVVLVAAGIFGPSELSLIGGALYVYLRGAVVFYALRALNPSRVQIGRLVWLLGALIGLEAVFALAQLIIGEPAYRALGWVDMEWADIGRAHALLDHPNDLGHFAGIMVLGVFALFAVAEKVSGKWWAALSVVALAFASAQSRESIVGVLLGALTIWLLSRAHGRRLAVASGVIILAAALPIVVSPSTRAEWLRRFTGVADALSAPTGEQCHTPEEIADPNRTCVVADREIRLLYFRQGADLLARRPVLGYGVGQFGGIVAYQNDPNWAANPRFGPNGFNQYGFQAKTVDSFWLHLVVETGLIGLAAYLVWLWLLSWPLVRVARRTKAMRSGPSPRAPAHPVFFWAPAAMVFVMFVALLSASLEDPLVPPLLFTVVGIAWVMLERGEGTAAAPATKPGVPADALRMEQT